MRYRPLIMAGLVLAAFGVGLKGGTGLKEAVNSGRNNPSPAALERELNKAYSTPWVIDELDTTREMIYFVANQNTNRGKQILRSIAEARESLDSRTLDCVDPHLTRIEDLTRWFMPGQDDWFGEDVEGNPTFTGRYMLDQAAARLDPNPGTVKFDMGPENFGLPYPLRDVIGAALYGDAGERRVHEERFDRIKNRERAIKVWQETGSQRKGFEEGYVKDKK